VISCKSSHVSKVCFIHNELISACCVRIRVLCRHPEDNINERKIVFNIETYTRRVLAFDTYVTRSPMPSAMPHE